MEDLLSLRTKLRTKATKLCNDLQSYRGSDRKTLDQDQLALKLHHVEKLQNELKGVQDKLDKLGQVDETSHMQTLEDEVFLGSRLLARLEREEKALGMTGPQIFAGNTDIKSSLTVKLPMFHGDIMQWSEFWDLFVISVHDNPRFANVQKFVVLKSHLAGVALKSIQGIPISENGYTQAVAALKERFELNDMRRETLLKELLNMTSVRHNDLKAMRSFIDHLSSHTRALSTLGVPSESFSSLLLPVAKDKIPEDWRLEWARRKSSSFDDFLHFLNDEIRLRESARGMAVPSAASTSAQAPSAVSSLNTRREPRATSSKPLQKTKWACACAQCHRRLDLCDKFRRMSVDERWKVAKESKACYRCLGSGHVAKDCKGSLCAECSRSHHSLLHNPRLAQKEPSTLASELSPEATPFTTRQPHGRETRSEVDKINPASPKSHRFNARSLEGRRSFFQTAVAEATGPKGQEKVRMLLDGGSDTSYIRSSLVERLGLPVTDKGTFSCLGFQEKAEKAQEYEQVQVKLKSRFGGPPVTLEAWSTEQLCSPLPTAPPPQVPSHLEMADDFGSGDIDILIGIDNMYHVVLWEQLELEGGLRAIETIFGYVLHGQCDDESGSRHHQVFHSRQVESMWDLDTVGIDARELKERDCSSYPQPVWNQDESRYEMGLIWNSEERPISNEQSIRIRTRRMADRLNEEKRDLYDQQMRGMMKDSVVELSHPEVDRTPSHVRERGEVDDLEGKNTGVNDPWDVPRDRAPVGASQKSGLPSTSSAGEFYLPHHGVHRNGKLRVVFDGSAKDGIGRSLNDYLDSGDNLLAKLPAVLLNFRSGAIGCQADIQAAFHQVVVQEEDRKYLQFFWADSRLRFVRVPFGLTCSPFMLLRTVDIHLSRYEQTDRDLCHLLQGGLYMDDICLHFERREEAEKGMSRTQMIFAEANMTLHKIRMTGDSSSETSVLGLTWDTKSDHLAVKIPDFPCPLTKSGLLSAIAKTFDPLGLLTPWLIGGKILFQRTWRDMPDAKWNDRLDETIQADVELWCRNAPGVSVSFPRPITAGGCNSNTEFHIFCDASEKAYCAAVYVAQDGESRLVMARGRLAPLNPNLTVPRLELMAAVSGARLMSFIKESLELDSPSVTFWTDSTDVLHWIRNQRHRKVFVRNRVAAILQLTEPERWNHVRGVDNPADLGTRGMSVQAMRENAQWWTGPSFLCQASVSSSPKVEERTTLSPEALQEEKAEASCRGMTPAKVTLKTQQMDTRLFDITACSSLTMVVNKTAWILRFIFNARHIRKDRKQGPLSSDERCEALRFWIKDAQNRAYEAEIQALKAKTLLPKESSLLKLRPQLDDNGILCAVPRTNEEPLPILPEFAHITTLVIDDAHRRCFHQGTRSTLAILSAEYLIRRRSVLRVVNTCRRCRRYKGMNYRSADGGLPSFRIEPSRAFTKVGLDFFGPLVTAAGSKVWVLLITCATSRAVHLELVKSQHTDEVKLALRRFFAIRGTPSLIFSDNARTFHALLGHLPRCVTWRFIPEAAPWWGGFWERMVGVTKKCLRITLHLCSLSHDELAATLYELAFHLNMRPLTTVDSELLTPAHLLFGVTSIRGVVSPPSFYCDSVTRAWRHQRRVSEHLIRRWTSEYIATLRCWSISPRGRPRRIPAVGDVVLVHSEGPRGRWPLARVTALIYGTDDHPRAAHIEMKGIKTRRPLSKLFHLEADS